MRKVWEWIQQESTQAYYAIMRFFMRLRRFVLYDIPSTLYDWEDTTHMAYLSLPRLMFFVSGSLIFVAYIRDHFFGVAFEHYGELVAFFSACGVSYVGKKFMQGRSPAHDMQYNKDDEIDKEDSDV